ncbi:MAG: ABC transporter ATP-binding protein, partial [Anaerolineae bacterium]
IQAFRREQAAIERFDQANARARKAGTLAETYIALLPPTISAISTLAIAVVVGVGGWLAIRQAISIGVIVSFITYARNFFEPVRSLSDLYNQLQAAMAGAERIFQLLDVRPDITDKPDAIELPPIQGHVLFDHVHFSYMPGVPVLKDICLEAKPGQTIALVGPTGAGKTTIVNLLSRFYDVDSGRIAIDGIDIRDVTQDSLRRQLGIVLQEPFLFSGTIMENIRYGRLDATDEEVIEAARLANADQFIRRLPDSYQTDISERGSNLSEGQRQLIAIARTILANPRILILDEATSSVDTRTEIHLQEALRKLMEGRTSFVIAHRLSTIRHADLVLVVHEGQIIERGTHEELLQKRGFYYQLYMSQFRRLEAIERLILPAGQGMHRAGPTLAPSGASGS